MTSSQVHLWSIGLWMLIGVLIISPTAGGGGLGRLRCNVDSEGGKYTSASPRCTCLPPRQHCAEVALGAFTTDSSAMLTRREASIPRLRLGVLASLLVNIALKLHLEESKYTSATPRCTCLDKPARLTIRVLWFLFLIVRRVPRPSESGCKKCNGLKKYLLGHTFSWKRLSAILCPWNPPWWWFFSLKLNKKCLKTPSKIKGLSFISSNLGNMDFFLIFNCISH